MPTYTIAGQQIKVEEGVSKASAADRAMNAGVLTPKQVGAEFGGALATQTGGIVDEALIGAGKAFADRSFGFVESDIDAPDTLASDLGSVFPLIAASFAVPGGIAAQAGIGAGLEALSDESDPLSILTQGAAGGIGAGVSKIVQRVLSGAGRIVGNIARSKPITTTVESGPGKVFAQTVKGAGAFGRVDDFNQTLINKAANKAILTSGKKVTPETLDQGAKAIGGLYDDFYKSANEVIDMGDALAIVEDIPSAVLPRKARLMAALKGTDAKAFQDADTLMRDLIPTMKSGGASQFSGELETARNLAGVASGGDQKILLEANKRWNVLKSLESIKSVIKQGDVPAGQLSDKFGAAGKKGLRGFTRGKGTGFDDVDELIDVTRKLASDPVPVGSPTASRGALLGPATLAGGGLLSGALPPEAAAGVAAMSLVPQLLGPAAFGGSAGALNQLGGGAARAADKLITGDDLRTLLESESGSQ